MLVAAKPRSSTSRCAASRIRSRVAVPSRGTFVTLAGCGPTSLSAPSSPAMLAPELMGTVATLYGVGAAGAALLQARQVLRRGSSCEVSARFFATYAGGYAVWLLYGLSIGQSAAHPGRRGGAAVRTGHARHHAEPARLAPPPQLMGNMSPPTHDRQRVRRYGSRE